MSEISTQLRLCRVYCILLLVCCEVVPGVAALLQGGHRMTNSRDHAIDRLVAKKLHRLNKYGALLARPGYEIAGRWGRR
jgi:hypothetical protein